MTAAAPALTEVERPPAALREAIAQRKRDHIEINLHQDVRFQQVRTGFEQVRFIHNALPELDLDGIDLSTRFLGSRLEVPLLISSMTGGIAEGAAITRRLAEAAQVMGCALGVGSQRIALEDPEQARHFRIRDVAPDVPVFANLGAVQLTTGFGLDACLAAVEMVEANALILHLNPLQEALQGGGDRDFRGLEERIARICEELPVPVIVKEIGFGISPDVARRLAAAGVSAIDVSGAGGTSWSAVEAHRAASPVAQAVAEAFGEWGIGTAVSLQQVRSALPGFPLIASGGLVNGLDAAKALALGGSLAGFAGPLLRAAVEGTDAVIAQLDILATTLRVAMFCAGAGSLGELGPHLLMADRVAIAAGVESHG